MILHKPLRWGILGPGAIAHAFARDIRSVHIATLTSVGSRSIKRAHSFKEQYSLNHAYGSYIELLKSENIDAVYIASPHSEHCQHALMAIECGKHVLIEKPITVNRNELNRITDAAKTKEVFVMEAMWMRYLPVFKKIQELIEANIIGKITHIEADFGFRSTFDHSHRLFNPNLAGGALLDVGIYPITLAVSLLGTPVNIESIVKEWKNGVDGTVEGFFTFKHGQTAEVLASIVKDTPTKAIIIGEKGKIIIPRLWFKMEKAIVKRNGKQDIIIKDPNSRGGFAYEIEAATKSILEGQLEQENMALDFSHQIITILDTIRQQQNFSYPFE